MTHGTLSERWRKPGFSRGQRRVRAGEPILFPLRMSLSARRFTWDTPRTVSHHFYLSYKKGPRRVVDGPECSVTLQS